MILEMKEISSLLTMLELEETTQNINWVNTRYSNWYFYQKYKKEEPLETFKIYYK